MKVFSVLYKTIFKPIAFAIDPEFVHDTVSMFGKILGKTRLGQKLIKWMFYYVDKSLEQDILDIHFPNPIGLSAGFDKDAELTDILPDVGFGFAEVGSITGEPCSGNPKQRLWRLPKSKSLLVWYGLKNKGAEFISKRLKNKQFSIPIGISVAKTNCAATVDDTNGINDYAKAFELFKNIGSYTTVNISCPNAFGGQPFTDPQRLDALLSKLDAIETTKPTFVKLSPDLSIQEVDNLLAVIDEHKVEGIICSNLTKNRDNQKIIEKELPTVGGFSGKVVMEITDNLISYVYKKTNGKYIIIGSGGVFSAEDAYDKIKRGASLIQLITGMIYEGPQLIGEINAELVKLLKADGYKNISEAIGVNSK